MIWLYYSAISAFHIIANLTLHIQAVCMYAIRKQINQHETKLGVHNLFCRDNHLQLWYITKYKVAGGVIGLLYFNDHGCDCLR